MGRSLFDKSEIDEIKVLISDLEKSKSNEKKHIRNLIRKNGFYISDFDKSNKGFTVVLFQELIDSGRIKIK